MIGLKRNICNQLKNQALATDQMNHHIPYNKMFRFSQISLLSTYGMKLLNHY